MISLAATGHRPDKLGGYDKDTYERLFCLASKTLGILTPRHVISGMALGWDTAVAEAAVVNGFPLHAYIPFKGQESRWPVASQRFYRTLLARAHRVVECSPPGYSVEKMQTRNCMMVDDCDLLLGLWDGSSGGTGNCVKYAQSVGREFMNLWPEWIK